MAREVRRFSVTIPAGTAQAAGFSADLSFPAREVRRIEVRVPPGPRGEVGFALGAAGVPIIPFNRGAYVVTNDEVVDWTADGYHDSGSWTFYGYNTGRYAHTLEVRFEVDLPGAAPSFAPAPLAGAVGLSGVAVAPEPVATAGASDSGSGAAVSIPPVTVAPIAVPTPAPIEIAPLQLPTLAPITLPSASVASLYTDLLGRPADPAGVQYWLAQSLGNGGPLSWPQLVVRFCGTTEALSDARLHPDAFVAGLYTVLLGRAATAAEVGYWSEQIAGPVHPAATLSGAQVAAAIAGTSEAQNYAAALPVGP